ncbi:MAG: peptidyl-prolyl cis-trans isomerase [Cystobacterineae bacterium]|nr:peptidyl-prolyl cis-trans isomerase [Cystobacterineae bacterium]
MFRLAHFKNTYTTLSALAALWLGWLGACTCNPPAALPPAPQLPAHWLAQVNGSILTLEDVENELALGLGSAENSAEHPHLSLKTLLAELIDKTLLLQEAHKRQLFPNPSQIKQHTQVLMSGFLGNMAENMGEAMADTPQLNMAHFEKITAQHMAIEALLYEEVFARIAITEEALRHFYEENAELFFAPTEIEASQIVVKTQQEANKLLRLLRAGHSFEKLARQYSIAPEAENGGKLGRFAQNVMPSPMDETLFSLRTNQVSSPTPSPFGWHLFWVQKKFRPQRIPFSKARNTIEARLVAERGTQMKAAFLQKLKSQAHVEIHEALLNLATWPPKHVSGKKP